MTMNTVLRPRGCPHTKPVIWDPLYLWVFGPCKRKVFLPIRKRIELKLEQLAIRFFAWAIAKPSVQRVIVEQFEARYTPMCLALSNAINNVLEGEGREVDADNVSGLERYIEHALEQAEFDAKNIQGLEEAIANHFDKNDLQEELADAVLAEIANRLTK